MLGTNAPLSAFELSSSSSTRGALCDFLLGDPPPQVRTVGDLADVIDRLADWADAFVVMAESTAEPRAAERVITSAGMSMGSVLRAVANALRTGERPVFESRPWPGQAAVLEAAVRELILYPHVNDGNPAMDAAKLLLEAAAPLREQRRAALLGEGA